MLELRPTCENCNKALPPDSLEARICTYECTFCATCVDNILENVCPNCGGGFLPRPIRPSKNWKGDNFLRKDPGSTKVKHRPVDPAVHARFSAPIKTHPASHSWTCPTCSSELSTPYCPSCGERPPRARDLTLRGLIHQLFLAFSSIDGRLFRSFRCLVTRPGALTVAYVQGRRIGYLKAASVIFRRQRAVLRDAIAD